MRKKSHTTAIERWPMPAPGRWGGNPRYLDFENLGGDCTSYASQCLFAGCGVMNYTPTFGWYYNSAGDRTPSWSGVEYLYNFLTGNKKTGPYAREANISELQPATLSSWATLPENSTTRPSSPSWRPGTSLYAPTPSTRSTGLSQAIFMPTSVFCTSRARAAGK